MPTIRDVAKAAGVSVGTVSHVLTGSGSVSKERRKRVLAVISELQYQPNPFYPQLVRGAEDAALKRHYILITVNTDDQVERKPEFISMLLARRVDGLLIVPSPNAKDRSHLTAAMATGVPVVAVDRFVESVPIDAVSVNNLKGAVMCMNHLIRSGHCRIVYLGADWDVSNAMRRLEGYHQALKDAGLPRDPALVCFGDLRLQSGYRLTKEVYLRADPPTAVFSANAMMGMGAMQAFQELRLRCPEEISLAVFDDLPFMSVIQPRPTVVAQPASDIGFRAAELLMDRIEGRERASAPVRIELEPELVVRDSSGPAPEKARKCPEF